MIDEGLAEAWPDDVLSSIRVFQQGDLIERPPFFYVASPRYGIWQFTKDVGDPEVTDDLLEVAREFCPPYGMVTTETCDLTEEDSARPRQPWVSVAPVYDVASRLDDNQADLLDRGRINYWRRVYSDLLAPGIWVVDARIEFPVEKSWFVGKVPIRTAKDHEARSATAGFLAGRRDRPVLSDSLHKALITPIRRWIEKLSTARRAAVLNGVAEVRLLLSGPPGDPDGAGVLVIGAGDRIPESVVKEWERKWEGWRERLDQVNIALLATAYETYDSLSARQYRESFEVRLDYDS
ncbi:MAG TPA: hypothetical protein VFB74_05915 [Kribbellaceae bacterium]|nr:hypothetical protein [Kribbellaceae bacterium]